MFFLQYFCDPHDGRGDAHYIITGSTSVTIIGVLIIRGKGATSSNDYLFFLPLSVPDIVIQIGADDLTCLLLQINEFPYDLPRRARHL